VWRTTHAFVIGTLRACDTQYQPRARALFDQLRRAAISVEANLVEGFALEGPALYRRHLRIALGSAGEAECLLRIAHELRYLPHGTVLELWRHLDQTIAKLFVMVRRAPSKPPR
jgi:four helix bundle protein